MSLKLEPIGEVVERGEVSQVKIFDKYADGLDHIEKFSHVVVLYWLHKISSNLRKTIKIKPLSKGVPTLGIFASRFPARPNPIGLTTVRLVSRNGCTLFVSGLDAEKGTPVLDLKPYIPMYDEPKERTVLPEWVKRHIKEHHEHHGEPHHKHHHYSFEEIMKMVKILQTVET
ncbi:MAG: tRNA (N6-threonylcarbamoyladenosine(37)-N6)-methyltransferase TrmO [Candidatus Freyarchaeota archaeon]